MHLVGLYYKNGLTEKILMSFGNILFVPFYSDSGIS